MLLLLLAIGGALLVVTPRRAGAAGCKPNRATCTANDQCCRGFCNTAGMCATPTSTTTTTTTSTTTTTLRFVDNGDGTVTDNQTGLQWEKKDNDCPGIHCVDGVYSWSDTGTAPDGTAFTLFLNTLNGGATGVGNCASFDPRTQTGGFVNQCDWRLPTSAELLTIIDTNASGCFVGVPVPGSGCDAQSSPCIDATFGPTAACFYWSSTTRDPMYAWGVAFDIAFPPAELKVGFWHVRAVRGGS